MFYQGLGCIEARRVSHTDYVYFETLSKSNMLMKIDRNWKGLRGSYKKLFDIKCIIFPLKLYSGVLRNGLNRAYCSVSARLKCQF